MRLEGARRRARAAHRSTRASWRRASIIEPGAIIGAEARIGRGTRIAAGAVIGYRVTHRPRLLHRPAGDRHACAGRRPRHHPFGRAHRPGRLRLRHGRAAATSRCRRSAVSSSRTTWRSAPIRRVDRGALKDTIIGEGTKIDNLVQIGHNVVIGRHCVIVAPSRHFGLDRAWRLRGHGRPVRRGRAHQDRHRRADRRRRSSDQGRRAAGRPHGGHAGATVEAMGAGDRLALHAPGQARRRGRCRRGLSRGYASARSAGR